MKKIITLTSDFGLADYYVPSLIGVIKSIAPDCDIHHLSHEISGQNIMEAAFVFKQSYSKFPKDTIHVVIVDPEVGGDRDAVIVRHQGYTFIAPDNGILTLTLDTITPELIYSISNSLYLPDAISPVFHGRDIFVPIAAHLSNGVPIQLLGNQKNELVDIRWSVPSYDKSKIIGQVVHVDHFGNLITNIHAGFIKEWSGGIAISVMIPGWDKMPLSKTYRDVLPGDPVAVIGSGGFLELAINQSRANTLLNMTSGVSVLVEKVDG